MIPLEPPASENPQDPGSAPASLPSHARGSALRSPAPAQLPQEALPAGMPSRFPARTPHQHRITSSGSPPAQRQIRSPHSRVGFRSRGILQPASGSCRCSSQVICLLLLHFAQLHGRLFSSQGSGLAGGVSHPIPPSLCCRASEGEGAAAGRGPCAAGGMRALLPEGCELFPGCSPQLPEGCGLFPGSPSPRLLSLSLSCCHTGCAGTAFLRDAWLSGGGGSAAGRGGERERDG